MPREPTVVAPMRPTQRRFRQVLSADWLPVPGHARTDRTVSDPPLCNSNLARSYVDSARRFNYRYRLSGSSGFVPCCISTLSSTPSKSVSGRAGAVR